VTRRRRAGYNRGVLRAALVPLLATAAGCGGGSSESGGGGGGGPAAFSWGVGQGLWGQEQLTIEEDGRAHYHFESARGQPSIDRTATLSTAELEPLRAATRQSSFCELRSRRDGIPDEGMPTLVVRSRDQSCTVTLWDGEWEDMPSARPVRDAVYHIIERLKGS
jgi:hypothetical protein